VCHAELLGDDEGRMAGNALVAISELHLGAPARAHSYFERAIALGEAARERRKDVGSQLGALAHRFVMDTHAVVRGYDSWCLWLLGYPDLAMQRADDAVAATSL
jgi:hypothetical protein